jgi:hypothetical protein
MMIFVLMHIQHVIDWFLIDAPTRQDRKIEKQRQERERRAAKAAEELWNTYARRSPEEVESDDEVFLANARVTYEMGLPARDEP